MSKRPLTLRAHWKTGPRDVVVIDTETTGFGRDARLVEVAAVHVHDGLALREFQRLVRPGVPIPRAATRVHGITDAMVRDAPDAADALRALLDFAGALPLVAHNAAFDTGVLARELARHGVASPGLPVWCSCKLARKVFPQAPSHSLPPLVDFLGLAAAPRHRALADAHAALAVLNACVLAGGGGLAALTTPSGTL